MKPTQLLRRMEQLLGGAKLESSIFTQLFLQRLPHHARSILASSRCAMTVNQLAQLADRIIEVHVSSTPGFSNITSPNATPSPQSSACSHGDDVKFLADQVQQLTLQVQSLTKELHQDRGRPSRYPRRGRYNRSRSRSRDGESRTLHMLAQNVGIIGDTGIKHRGVLHPVHTSLSLRKTRKPGSAGDQFSWRNSQQSSNLYYSCTYRHIWSIQTCLCHRQTFWPTFSHWYWCRS